MIRTFYATVQQRRWNRDRSRRIAETVERDATLEVAEFDRHRAMARQLIEIRALPERPEPEF